MRSYSDFYRYKQFSFLIFLRLGLSLSNNTRRTDNERNIICSSFSAVDGIGDEGEIMHKDNSDSELFSIHLFLPVKATISTHVYESFGKIATYA